MKKNTFYFLSFCLIVGITIGSASYFTAEAGDGRICGTCQPNPNFPGLTFCNFVITGGGCGGNSGAICSSLSC